MRVAEIIKLDEETKTLLMGLRNNVGELANAVRELIDVLREKQV